MVVNRLAKYKVLVTFSSFLIIISMFTSKAHAIVVAPFVAIGAVHLVAWFIGVVSVPILFLVKTMRKTRWLKAILITITIVALFGSGFLLLIRLVKSQGTEKFFGNDVKEVPYIDYPLSIDGPPSPDADRYYLAPMPPRPQSKPLGILLLITTVVLSIPTLLALLAIDHGKNRWGIGRKALLSLAISVVLSSVILFGLFTVNFGSFIN
ncbi:MAG: hypothetical protein WC243_02655 [Patescibacteria group bacterium]|jgi:hypothetical protein